MVYIGSGAERIIEDYELSRYACYLIVQNGDPRKKVITLGQSYFAIKTQQQELIENCDELTEEQKRLSIRNEMIFHNKYLAEATQMAGVTEPKDFAIFQNKGYSFRNSLLKKESELGILGHVLHDGRHTFSTFAKEYGVDEYARKKFMGHSIKDLTDRVYTHMDIEWFRTEIEKIL
jgi:integrase